MPRREDPSELHGSGPDELTQQDPFLTVAEIMRDLDAAGIRPRDAADVRRKTGLGQAEFAILLGVTTRTVARWESGDACPAGPARVLLDLVRAKGIEAVR